MDAGAMMTLGNMRENGERSLAITCGALICDGVSANGITPKNVRFWPKADTPSCAAHVRYWG
jgi:hypothetical protein